MPSCFDRVVILRSRNYVFVIVVVMGILWIGLLSADAFMRGGYRTVQESVSTIIFLAIHALSALCIPILALLDVSDTIECTRWYSHVWFELLSLNILFVLHFAAALLFTILSPSFNCENSNADSEVACKLVNVYISMASWITPMILFSFICYFSFISFRTAKRFPALWHTPVRFCPWDDRDMQAPVITYDVEQCISQSDPWKMGGSRNSDSQLSSPQVSSRGSSQTLVPVVTSVDPSPRRTSHPPRHLPHPPVSGRVGSRYAPSPASRMISRPLPSRPVFQQTPSRALSQLPPARFHHVQHPFRHTVTFDRSRPGMTLSLNNSPMFPRFERVRSIL